MQEQRQRIKLVSALLVWAPLMMCACAQDIVSSASEKAPLQMADKATASNSLGIRTIATEKTRLTEKDFEVNSLAWSPDGKYLATTGILTKSVNIWDVEKRQVVRTLMSWVPGHAWSGLAYSPDGRFLAGCQHSKGIKVRVWDPMTGQVVHDADSNGSCETLAFSPDGKWLVAGYRGGDAKALEEFKSVVFVDTMTWRVAKAWTIPGLYVEKIAFKPDGKELAVAGSRFPFLFPAGVIQVWTVDSGEKVKETVVHAKTEVLSLAYSMSGQFIAAGTSTGPGRRSLDLKSNQWFQQNNTEAIRLWDVSGGEITTLLSTDLPNGTHVGALSYTSDGKYLIAGGWDSSLHIWDATNYQLLQTIKTSGPVLSMRIKSDSAEFAASIRNTVTIWKLE